VKRPPYLRGLHDLGADAWAYLQPDGGWGWSNAGLVVDGDAALLVDTLFDEALTADMLGAIRAATGRAAEDIGVVVNTHANGDHTHGNALLPHARIVATRASAAEMEAVTPQMLAAMMAQAPRLGEAGAYLERIFGPFDFARVRGRQPTDTFSGRLTLSVGDTVVELIEVGPAHTQGDLLVHVPARRLVFTGDVVFADVTPVMWAGPVGNWLRACDAILALNAEVVVPGHGPLTDARGVERVRDYLRYVDSEARRRYDAGLSVEEAVADIALGDYASWIDAERIAVNVDTLYREYRGDRSPPDFQRLFGLMAQVARARPSWR
jgi:cyclase